MIRQKVTLRNDLYLDQHFDGLIGSFTKFSERGAETFACSLHVLLLPDLNRQTVHGFGQPLRKIEQHHERVGVQLPHGRRILGTLQFLQLRSQSRGNSDDAKQHSTYARARARLLQVICRNLGSATRTKTRIDSSRRRNLASSMESACGVMAEGTNLIVRAGAAAAPPAPTDAGFGCGARRSGGRRSSSFFSLETRRNFSRAAA